MFNLTKKKTFSIELYLNIIIKINLSFNKLNPPKEILDEIHEIEEQIDFFGEITETSLKDIYGVSTNKSQFTMGVSFYLRQKLLVEKLQELLDILVNYKPIK